MADIDQFKRFINEEIRKQTDDQKKRIAVLEHDVNALKKRLDDLTGK